MTKKGSIDVDLFEFAQTLANKYSDGHLTIMKFTSNWRVSFSTPSERADIDRMAEGETFQEALGQAIAYVGLDKTPPSSQWLPELDWGEAPDWARWSAVDEDGLQHWFNFKPNIVPGWNHWVKSDPPTWEVGDPVSMSKSGGYYGYRAGWQDSLRERPKSG